MFGLRRKNRAVYSTELGHAVRELPPLTLRGAQHEFISIPSMDIPALAEKYVSAMETEESADWCRCEWHIHPDDIGTTKGACRICNNKDRKALGHTEMPDHPGHYYDHKFAGVRKRRGDEAPDCPVHTREGMIIYFFEWIFTNAAD